METHRPKPLVSLVECPRDAMQGWKNFIPTDKKIAFLNTLLKVGFDTLDFGSFVSAKAIPQMADTKEVLAGLDNSGSATKLLSIVANTRGAKEACQYDRIACVGFPFSVSATFQHRNANSTPDESLKRVMEIQRLCVEKNKELVVYISMAFGNPYGDAWSENIVFDWVGKIASLGIRTISLADTVGLATPEQVFSLTSNIINRFNAHDIGVHLHSSPVNWKVKIDAALDAGCRRIDGALKGIGGCPMAGDELVGNMDTELMIPYFQSRDLLSVLDEEALRDSIAMASAIFV